MLQFVVGWIAGILTVIGAVVAFVFWPSKERAPPRTLFAEQFQPLIIPQELRDFIKSGKDGRGLSEEESCFSLSLIFHFLYQEHKDTRKFRRWVHKRLQLELNDLTSRNAAVRLIEAVRIRDLTVGNQFPVFNNIRVENVRMNENDKELFESVSFIVDVDYKGGFQTSIDVNAVFGRFAHLAIKVTRVSGKIRVTLSRQPFAHWFVSFIDMPDLDFKIESQIQGRQLKHLIPLISQLLRKAVARKHVFPSYKIRYRPFFPNPILQPSAPMDAFRDVPIKGAIEVTVLQCTRLNTALGYSTCAPHAAVEVYCVISLEQRPFIDNADSVSIQSFTTQLKYARNNLKDPLGLTFAKSVAELGVRCVQIAEVEPGSIAERGGFKPDDVILAVNNIPAKSERQVMKLLSGTVGELLVLVQRHIGEEDQDQDATVNKTVEETHDNEFVLLGPPTPASGIQRCHSDGAILSTPLSTEPSSPAAASADLHFSATEPIFCMEESVRDEIASEEPPTPLIRESICEDEESLISENTSLRMKMLELSQTNVRLASSVPVSSSSNIDIPGAAAALRRVRSEAGLYSSSEISDSHFSETLSKSVANMCCDTTTEEMEAGSANESSSLTAANRTDSTGGDTQSIDSNSMRSTRRERIQARASEMAMKLGGVGRAKVNELWNRRSKHSSTSDSFHQSAVELATEAEELRDEETTPKANGKRSPTSGLKKKLSSTIKKSSPKSSRHDITPTSEDSPKQRHPGVVVKKSTKPVTLSEDVMWGQSLHFGLDKKTTKYMNISVYAKPEGEDVKPILLGYNYVYLAQVIADCNLTASNCHREVFNLKPPAHAPLQQTADIADLSKHPGFDARLCYGDIKLGFRFFPDGLPEGFVGNTEDESRRGSANTSEEVHPDGQNTDGGEIVDQPVQASSLAAEHLLPATPHKWTSVTLRSGQSFVCQSCHGKIWLKSASRCTACNTICHTKCTQRANANLECKELQVHDQEGEESFELLSEVAEENEQAEGDDTSTATAPMPTTPQMTRRRRIANKVSEKLSYWRSSKKKNSPPRDHHQNPEHAEAAPAQAEPEQVPAPIEVERDPTPPPNFVNVTDVIPEITASLEGSEFLEKLRFEIGNSYNEMIINEARTAGAEIFGAEAQDARRLHINEQIDKIQTAINETTGKRRFVLQSKTGDDSDEFRKMEVKLQALALLMLHYCAGLQNCVESDETEAP